MKKLAYIGVILFIITCLLISVSCSASKTSVQSNGTIWGTNAVPGASGGAGRVVIPTVATTTTPPKVINSYGSTTDLNGQTGNLDIQRMIVRTSDITLMVSDIPTAMDKISQLASNMQGFVVSSNQWKDNGALLGTITIRVPADQFDSAMSTLRGMADEVTSENTSAQDVTQQYTDLNAQLTNLQATEAQLLDIMKKAVTVDDILAVQSQLTNTEGQIESIKGQIQYLQQTSATSLISVSLTQSKLTVQLTASNGRNVRSGDNVYFTATVTGGFTPYNYKWDFGDKSTGTDESPVHVYNSSGKFTVSLTVTDDKGNAATDTRTDYVTVQSGWNVGNVARTAWSGLRSFGRVLVNIIIWLGIFSPVWIIGGGIGIWIWRRRKMKAKVS
jgi:hypothetical protein